MGLGRLPPSVWLGYAQIEPRREEGRPFSPLQRAYLVPSGRPLEPFA